MQAFFNFLKIICFKLFSLFVNYGFFRLEYSTVILLLILFLHQLRWFLNNNFPYRDLQIAHVISENKCQLITDTSWSVLSYLGTWNSSHFVAEVSWLSESTQLFNLRVSLHFGFQDDVVLVATMRKPLTIKTICLSL